VNVKEGLLEKHPEGRYYMSHNGGWIDAGTDAQKAQRNRKQRLALDEFNRLSDQGAAKSMAVLPGNSNRITLAAAAETGALLKTLMQELGHESLAVTQDYLADVR
jgi:hypothetical protein